MPQTNKARKAAQRQEYHQRWKKFRFNHGNGLWIRRKEQSALGSKGGSTT